MIRSLPIYRPTSSTVSDPISFTRFSFLISFVSRPFQRDTVSWMLTVVVWIIEVLSMDGKNP